MGGIGTRRGSDKRFSSSSCDITVAAVSTARCQNFRPFNLSQPRRLVGNFLPSTARQKRYSLLVIVLAHRHRERSELELIVARASASNTEGEKEKDGKRGGEGEGREDRGENARLTVQRMRSDLTDYPRITADYALCDWLPASPLVEARAATAIG